jgi:uncharacterized membrane protein
MVIIDIETGSTIAEPDDYGEYAGPISMNGWDTDMENEYDLDDHAREILEGLNPVITRGDVAIHAAEGVSEDLHEALLTVLREPPDLWFVGAKTKDGKTVLIHRGPHP